MDDLNQYTLGEGDQTLELSTSDENREVVLAMAKQAQRSILIMSRHLDPAIYDNRELADALSHFVRSHRRAEVRILVQDSDPVIKHGHHLVQLAYRLSSMVSIHKPDEEHAYVNEALFIADGTGFIKRNLADRYEGVASFHAPLQARELADYFNTIWSHSHPDPQLRRLHLGT